MEITAQDEQKLCISCGFCCDKTLFDYARIEENEPVRDYFKKSETTLKGKRYFTLPCIYFDSKCTIYDQQKPAICSKFKCTLLKKMIGQEVTPDEALEVVKNAKKTRQEIIEEYTNETGNHLPFRDILHECIKNPDFDSHPDKKRIKFKVLLLDMLLSTEFKSREEFEMFYETIDD